MLNILYQIKLVLHANNSPYFIRFKGWFQYFFFGSYRGNDLEVKTRRNRRIYGITAYIGTTETPSQRLWIEFHIYFPRISTRWTMCVYVCSLCVFGYNFSIRMRNLEWRVCVCVTWTKSTKYVLGVLPKHQQEATVKGRDGSGGEGEWDKCIYIYFAKPQLLIQ